MGNAVVLGVYKVPKVRDESVSVATNKVAIGAYRGVGFSAPQLARETLIDKAARQLGISPFEIRRRNVVRPEEFPYTNRMGMTMREGSFLETIDTLEKMVGYDAFRARQEEARARGKYLGLGVSVFNEVTGVYGFGTYASRGAVVGAGSIGRAASIVRERMKQLAANLFETSPDDIVLDGGKVHVAGVPAKGMAFAEVAGAAYFAEETHPAGFDATLEATANYDPSDLVLANGGHVAVVEVDPETCRVRVVDFYAVEDCGKMINPMIVEGQMRGGMAQAIGMALLEEIVHDENGQLLTTTFMDYLMPTAQDVPDIKIEHLETPSPLVPGGIKGMGESAMISAPAAVFSAVNDAMSVVQRLRALELAKAPGIAETLDWGAALQALGSERLDKDALDATLGTILKYHEDQVQVRRDDYASLDLPALTR